MGTARQWIWDHSQDTFKPYGGDTPYSIEDLEEQTLQGGVFVHQDERGRHWFISEGDSSRWHDGEELNMGGECYDKARLAAIAG